jgi:replication fork protection complex subunit Tof1/Swi1
MDEVITVTSGDSDNDDVPIELTRRDILAPVINRVVDALGGFEGTPPTYRLGDSVLPCLSDLKKLWRKDDTDDDRTCAHIFWESRVLLNDLVPILLVLCQGGNLKAGGGVGVEDKRAIAVADLCCAMTWPIDMAEELKELDEEYDKGVDFTQLLHSHLIYKAALLRPGVIHSLFALVLPPLAKPIKERTPRDGQIINLILHLIRNLAFIRDLPRDVRSSADQAELGGLQGRLIRQLEKSRFLELLLVIAANKNADPLFNSWNTLVLEIFYLLFRGVRPGGLCVDPVKVHCLLFIIMSFLY